MIARSQPITIHQFHYGASSADAITQHMLWIRSTLKEAGIAGEIFVGESRAPSSYGLRAFDRTAFWDCDLVLVHHSHGNPLLNDVLKLEIPKALIYHNVTPAAFFSHDPHLASFSHKGRKQISDFLGKVVAAFGDSRYNCAELEVAGLHSAEVFPLLDLKQAPPLAALATRPPSNDTSQLLFVGKQTPHKNQALLIQTLFYLKTSFGKKYRLVLVGRSDRLYGEYLRLLAKTLDVADQIEFTGPVSAARLEEIYLTSSALVCVSLHEGFCVPLVEAMQRQVPVFALPTSGVRETLGQAGVRFASGLPLKIAESIDTVLSDARAVQWILESQEKRVKELAEIHNAERMQALCLQLVEKIRRTHRALPEVYL